MYNVVCYWKTAVFVLWINKFKCSLKTSVSLVLARRIVERAKRERTWKSPHARKGDTLRGERKMREGRRIPDRRLERTWPKPEISGTSGCWFSHDVTRIRTTKLSILLRFYFHGVLEQLKTNFQTNFRLKRVLGFVIEYAWISKLLRDAAFTWRPKELSFRLKKWLFSRNFAI